LNYSKQRAKILEVVKNNCNHPNADIIYKEVKKTYPNISLGTVYRNLNQLAEMGEIKKISMASQGDRFDKTLFTHSHIHCIDCDKVEDIKFMKIDDWSSKIEKENNYKLLSCDVVFEGICSKCQKNRKKD